MKDKLLAKGVSHSLSSQLTRILRTHAAMSVLGHGLLRGAGLGGPVGAALNGVKAVSGSAYRVTIPAVLQIACLRRMVSATQVWYRKPGKIFIFPSKDRRHCPTGWLLCRALKTLQLFREIISPFIRWWFLRNYGQAHYHLDKQVTQHVIMILAWINSYQNQWQILFIINMLHACHFVLYLNTTSVFIAFLRKT